MNWTFNQNCQLIIDEIPEKGSKHLLEVIIYPNDAYEMFVDRIGSIKLDLPEDGLYQYKYLTTDRDPSTIDISTIPNNDNSIGDWSGLENIFSLCHLRKCAVAYEKQSIEEFLSTCNKRNCNKKSYHQSTRDILLISLFVLEHLICEDKYLEAQRILDALGTCGGLCENRLTKSCCCNG